MSVTTLTPVLFMNAATSAGTYPNVGFLADFRYGEDKLRSISGTRVDVNDTIHVLLETLVPQFALDGTPTTSIIVTATATSFTSSNGTSNSCVLQGPFSRVKLQKVGASGAATFVGII